MSKINLVREKNKLSYNLNTYHSIELFYVCPFILPWSERMLSCE